MEDMVRLLTQSLPLYAVFSALADVFVLSACIFFTASVFHIVPAKTVWRYGICLGGICVTACVRTYCEHFGGESAVLVLLAVFPFLCVALLYAGKNVWKALLVSLGCNLLTGVLKYFLLTWFFAYDLFAENTENELMQETIVALLLFLIAFVLYVFYAKNRRNDMAISRINVVLYLLILLTLTLFTVTVVYLGLNFRSGTRFGFSLTMANIPMFTLTVGYAVKNYIRSKDREESYKKMLEMQVRHFQMMDQKNDELRMFRHDMPKKLSPLLLLKQGQMEDAIRIVEDFNISVEASRPRFHSGNPALDTVLEWEAQVAEKENITVVLTEGSVFPDRGIEAQDIFTIFPNALDNALEACRRMNAPATVTVTSVVNAGTVFVSISNPVNHTIVPTKDGLRSDKPDGQSHGYGTKSIRKCAAKYGSGNVHFICENGTFTLQLTLHPSTLCVSSEQNIESTYICS